MKQALIFLCFLVLGKLRAQTPDVLAYRFHLTLSDAHDSIQGLAIIRFTTPGNDSAVRFDLAGIRNGKGMLVRSVRYREQELPFVHFNNELRIGLGVPPPPDSILELTIAYAGIPADGLIISKNKYGDRTFFADNWPDRARHWIPCNDRPDDKASVEFLVTAPGHYQVISNGLQVEETNIGNDRRRTVWREDIAIATKIMVIGVARMAVGVVDSVAGVPVSAWVYPQDRDKGFADYRHTADMLRFFSDYIGPYAYRKLANVQSKTIFGGMENASAIFYAENSITEDRASEGLMAHEVAHQWFGNTVTEKSFAHLWLSEGFATYLASLYLEQRYGTHVLQDQLSAERDQVIGFAREHRRSVIDETTELKSLLNANSYQKGAWVLHMLRRHVGDAVFRSILQTYYARYRGGNAETENFERIAEEKSGRRLDTFFGQWLRQPGVPDISARWKWAGGRLTIGIQQNSESHFHFPLELALVDNQGVQTVHRLRISKIKESFVLPARQKPTVVLLDPAVNLLFTGTATEQ